MQLGYCLDPISPNHFLCILVYLNLPFEYNIPKPAFFFTLPIKSNILDSLPHLIPFIFIFSLTHHNKALYIHNLQGINKPFRNLNCSAKKKVIYLIPNWLNQSKSTVAQKVGHLPYSFLSLSLNIIGREGMDANSIKFLLFIYFFHTFQRPWNQKAGCLLFLY